MTETNLPNVILSLREIASHRHGGNWSWSVSIFVKFNILCSDQGIIITEMQSIDLTISFDHDQAHAILGCIVDWCWVYAIQVYSSISLWCSSLIAVNNEMLVIQLSCQAPLGFSTIGSQYDFTWDIIIWCYTMKIQSVLRKNIYSLKYV